MRSTPRRLALVLLTLAFFSAAPVLAAERATPGFDAESFRKNFVAGISGRPNAPALTMESVHVEAAEKAASFAGTEIFVVKGQLVPENSQPQPFMMFVSADGQFYVSDIVDMRAGKSILKEARERMQGTELKNMGHAIFKGTGAPVVTFVSDPFCPYCRTAFAFLERKKSAFSEFRLVHYPLASHPGADIACALMVWAAEKEPKRLEEFVHFAYTDLPLPKVGERTPTNMKKAWVAVATAFLVRFPELKALGKNGEAIVAALGTSEYASAVAADIAKATSMDISGTPIIFVGSTRVEGFDDAKLEKLLK